MATKISADIVEDGKNFINILQESMAGAEESVQASRDRAEIMLRLLQEILGNAEELSRQSKDTWERNR